MARLTSFRISHISDLHLTPTDDQRRSEPNLFGALRGMNTHFRSIMESRRIRESDCLLVTGDVTDRGDILSWRIFWKEISKARMVKKTLVVPGNHDVCCLGVRIRLSRDTGLSDLEKAIAGLEIGKQPTKFPWAKRVDPHVVIFGLETNNAGNSTVLDNAVGNIGYYQLLRLGQLLRAHQNVPVKIVALHHSPNIPEQKTATKRGQRPMGSLERLSMQMNKADRECLRILCASHAVRLIVHGHIHQADDRRVNGIRIIGAPASTEPVRALGSNYLRYYEYIIHGTGGRVTSFLRDILLNVS